MNFDSWVTVPVTDDGDGDGNGKMGEVRKLWFVHFAGSAGVVRASVGRREEHRLADLESRIRVSVRVRSSTAQMIADMVGCATSRYACGAGGDSTAAVVWLRNNNVDVLQYRLFTD